MILLRTLIFKNQSVSAHRILVIEASAPSAPSG